MKEVIESLAEYVKQHGYEELSDDILDIDLDSNTGEEIGRQIGWSVVYEICSK